MSKKLLIISIILSTALNVYSPENTQLPSPANTEPIFKASENPTKPNVLQKALVFLSGTQQNHWTPANMVKFYAPLAITTSLMSVNNSHGFKNEPLTNKLLVGGLFSVLAETAQHSLCNHTSPDMIDAFNKALETSWLSNHAQFGNLFKESSNRYFIDGDILRSIIFVRLITRAYRTRKLISDIETECKKLNISSNISKGSIPTTDEFLLLKSDKTLLIEIVRLFLSIWYSKPEYAKKIIGSKDLYQVFINHDLKTGIINILDATSNTNYSDRLSEGLNLGLYEACREPFTNIHFAASFVFAVIYLYNNFFNRIIIPYETLEKLSPELQQRAYDLMWINKTQL